MEGIDHLKKLLDEVAHMAAVNSGFRNRFSALSPEDRAEELKIRAIDMEIDPEVVDNFDLAGIEARDIEEFMGEVLFRFFEDEGGKGPERISY